MHGVQQMSASGSVDTRFVFVKPPSFVELEKQLGQHVTENDKQIQGDQENEGLTWKNAVNVGFYDAELSRSP